MTKPRSGPPWRATETRGMLPPTAIAIMISRLKTLFSWIPPGLRYGATASECVEVGLVLGDVGEDGVRRNAGELGVSRVGGAVPNYRAAAG